MVKLTINAGRDSYFDYEGKDECRTCSHPRTAHTVFTGREYTPCVTCRDYGGRGKCKEFSDDNIDTYVDEIRSLNLKND